MTESWGFCRGKRQEVSLSSFASWRRANAGANDNVLLTLHRNAGYCPYSGVWCVAEVSTMRDTLEKLYFGNLTPNERQIEPGSALRKAMDQAEQQEEQLTAQLEGEEKTMLLRLLNAENEIASTFALENFVLGFRLGARMILEVLDENDGALTDLDEE